MNGGLTKTRIEALTDGVFAIAMTLLVFGIRVPEVPSGSALALSHRLAKIWPHFLIYAISFINLSVYWVGHHGQFHYIRRTDRVLLWINLFFLLFVTFIPFSTALMGEYPNQPISVILYSANLSVVGLMLLAHWSYATSHRRLVDRDLDAKVVHLAKRRILVGIPIFLLALTLSFVNTKVSVALCAFVPVLYILPGHIDRYWMGKES